MTIILAHGTNLSHVNIYIIHHVNSAGYQTMTLGSALVGNTENVQLGFETLL